MRQKDVTVEEYSAKTPMAVLSLAAAASSLDAAAANSDEKPL